MASLVIFIALLGSMMMAGSSSQLNNSYFILAPNVFRPGSALTMKVTIMKASGPVDVTAGIKYRYNSKNKRPLAISNKTFEAGTTADMSIKIPAKIGGFMPFNLFVKGSGGLRFYHQSSITFRSKGLFIYVQMDKAIYKAGQTAHMRIFALLPNLKSYLGKISVDIVDPNNYKMAHWTDLEEPLGIIKKDFPLSSQPVKGRWQVSVTAKGEKLVKYFEVKNYVLPKFEVSLTLPPYILKKDTKLQGSVNAKYTYGQGVKGSVLLEVYFNHIPLKTTFEMDGTGSFSFDMKEIKTLFRHTYACRSWVNEEHMYFSWYSLNIKAKVTDKLTGKTADVVKSLKFYRSDIKLQFPSFNPSNFKPGLELIILLKVTKPNGQSINPETLNTTKVLTTISYQHGVRNVTKATYTPSPEGTVVIRCDVPSFATIVRIQAQHQDVLGNYIQAYFSASKSLSPSNSYIRISTSTSSVKSGETIQCKVMSNFPMTSFVYLVMGRGDITHISSQKVKNGTKHVSFNITSSTSMAPSARIVVYSIQKDGEVVVDGLTVSVENPFDNEVSIDFQRNSSRPGRNINLVARATPGSHVAILAVDKSVLLMKKDNDISRSQILRDVQSYSSGYGWYPWWDWGWYQGMMAFYTYGVDAKTVFKNAGLITFSDCLVYSKPRIRLFQWASAPIEEMEEVDVPVVRRRKQKLAAVEKVRSFFPETWLWLDVNTSSSGKAEISATVPDTMTAWVASAFAISPKTGFGIGALKPELRVFQPFFISLDLPYSVVRGEEVAIKVLVFNYLEKPQEVTVTFKASEHFKIISPVGPRGVYSQKMLDIKEVVSIPAGQGKAIAFPIIPTTLGNIPLVVQAQSYVAADAVRRNLLVEPEGIPQQYSYSLLIDLNKTSSFTKTLQLALPRCLVKGSAHAKISLLGDIMGSSFNNVHNLLRMPYGCGEQNMVKFAPNVFILKYLTAINRVTQAIKFKAEAYMVQGYLGEQRYRHKDGSYSAFGERDPEGSMWLTAFVVKSFAQARNYIYIDPRSLDLSLRWIQSKQSKDGSFPKVGYVSNYLKGGVQGEVSLTAFVVIALAEAGHASSSAVAKAKQKAVNYLERHLENVTKSNDVYALAITAYALRLVNSGSSTKAKQVLLSKAIRKDGTVHWSNTKKHMDSSVFLPYYMPRPRDIEITAYALLALSLDKDITNGLPVVRWLSQQRNSLGGYASTQDTVLGIQAMSEFAALTFSPSNDFKVKLEHSADKTFSKILTVNKNNIMVLQQVLVSKVEGNLIVTANGHGIGMLQVGVTYNVKKEPQKTNFEFFVKVIKNGDNEIETKACARWQGDGNSSDMAVIEIGVVSGFRPDGEIVSKLMNDKELALKRVDSREKKLIMYFDKIDKSNATCFVMRFERTHSVGKGQPVPAVVYDYYNPEHRAQVLYTADQLKDVSVCSICPLCINCKAIVNEATQGPSRTSNNYKDPSVIGPTQAKLRKNSFPGFCACSTVTLTSTAFSLVAFLRYL